MGYVGTDFFKNRFEKIVTSLIVFTTVSLESENRRIRKDFIGWNNKITTKKVEVN